MAQSTTVTAAMLAEVALFFGIGFPLFGGFLVGTIALLRWRGDRPF
jgi:hypothetical protein